MLLEKIKTYKNVIYKTITEKTKRIIKLEKYVKDEDDIEECKKQIDEITELRAEITSLCDLLDTLDNYVNIKNYYDI